MIAREGLPDFDAPAERAVFKARHERTVDVVVACCGPAEIRGSPP